MNTEPILVDPTDERRILDLRPLGFRDVVVLGHYRYAKAHHSLESHQHGNRIEICYLESGQQTYYVGQQRYDLTGGDLFVTFPGEVHGSGPAPEDKGSLCWVIMTVPSVRQRFLGLVPSAAQQLIGRILSLRARHFHAGETPGRILARVFAAFDRRDDPLRVVQIQNLLLRFLLDLLDTAGRTERWISPEIRRIQERIVHHPEQTYVLRQLARSIHLSESRFKARFKKEVGIAPADFILRKRIERAAVLIQSSDRPIQEIARELSFSTSQYFATVFRRYLDQTPSQYRNACRVNPQAR